MTLKLGMQHQTLEYYQVCPNDDPGLTLTYFMARSNLIPFAFVWEKGKTMDFSETIVLYDLKLAKDDRSDKSFCWHQNFVLWGLYGPCPGAIYMYKIMKKLYKIRLQRDFFETCSKWPKWQEVSADIKILSHGVVCPWPEAIYIY